MFASLRNILLALSIILLETSVLPQYLNPLYKPDLLLVLMVVIALRSPITVSALSAYLLGLLKDCVSGMYLGLNGFSFLLVYLILKGFSDQVYVRNAMLLVVAVASASLAVTFSNALLLLAFSDTSGVFTSMLSALAPQLLINCFVASLITIWPETVGSFRSIK